MKIGFALLALAVLFVVEAQVSMHNPTYCYSSDPIRPQNGMHSSQSSYEAIRRNAVDPSVSSCNPSRFWFLSRHGGRLPSASTILAGIELTVEGTLVEDILSNNQAGRTSMCAADITLIREWISDPNITVENADLLTVSGWNIMKGVAQRYQELFPTLLPENFSPVNYTFRHTDRQRSQGSIRAFADGLFGQFENVIFEAIPTQDSFLRPHDFCPAFTSAASSREADAFLTGPEFRETMLQVNAKLGFIGANQLSVQSIRTIWDICRFEKNIDLSVPSPWCSAFSVANNQVFEYHADLEYYYINGYGVENRRLVENLNCGLMQDMLRFLQSSNANDAPARILGTHSSVLQLFLVALGAFEDDNALTRHNFAQQMTRQWRTSWISPKGANLAVVRYDCVGGDNDVLFLFNERPLQVPGCQSNGLCKVNFILQQYNRFLNANCASVYCTSN